MIKQVQLGQSAMAFKRQLVLMIRSGGINLSGNGKLKIYGTLKCASGKRMKDMNRVFFATEVEAVSLGYRPCGHCMKQQYRQWKAGQANNE
jgi:hypothetical protein